MGFLTTVEMSEKWCITRRRIAELCRKGRIEGAVLKGKTWLIPEGTVKPEDPRKNRHQEIEKKERI